MNRLILVILFFLMSLPSVAQPVTLEHLLAVEKGCWSPAWVTSGFYDWRTVSRYRRRAGLHLGYDIAMPYGSPVAAAWPGRVVAVTPWTSSEYGVTVLSPQGWEVTYGHISPNVRVGSQVACGTVIGTIASDHVDVKMRDHTGAYVPFSEKAPVVVQREPQEIMKEYEEAALKESRLETEIETLVRALAAEEKKRVSNTDRLAEGRRLAERGLLSERELQTLEAQCTVKARDPKQRLANARRELKALQTTMKLLEKEATEQKLSLPKVALARKPESSATNSGLDSLVKRGLMSQREWEEATRE